MGNPKVEVFEDASGQWRFRLKGGNGEIVASSEAYTRRVDAERGAAGAAELIVAIANVGAAVADEEQQ